jgi:hypothetical protein
MAIGFVMTFDGITEQHYEAVMAADNLDLRSPGNTNATDKWPDGLIAHYAGATERGWCVVDIWDSQAAFDDFLGARLGPALARTGVPQPNVTTFDLYNQHR